MNAEQQCFLNAIVSAPDDDAPRLAFADFLETHGDFERAEFIRLQLALAEKPKTGIDRNAPIDMFGQQERKFLRYGKRRKAMSKRSLGLLRKNYEAWSNIGKLCWCSSCSGIGSIQESRNRRSFCLACQGTGQTLRFARGFVSHAVCSMADWETMGPAVVRNHPVDRVSVCAYHPYDIRRLQMEWNYCWVPWPLDHPWGGDWERAAPTEARIPTHIYRFLNGHQMNSVGYDSVTAALDDFSRACLAWAKSHAT